MNHTWQENVLAPARFDLKKPQVNWFPTCAACGCLVTGSGASLIYRATPRSEWSKTEPACAGDTKGKT